ncbi:hypothetical protein D3D02_17560 [Halobellus sp. Atlit-38R]|nr:hypothetical protein D3D02_17560 [Halobellus sp. Atlit-38R]
MQFILRDPLIPKISDESVQIVRMDITLGDCCFRSGRQIERPNIRIVICDCEVKILTEIIVKIPYEFLFVVVEVVVGGHSCNPIRI